MVGGRQAPDIDVEGDKPREELVSFAPSASSDGMLGFTGNNDGRVGLYVEGATFVGNDRGGVIAGPPEPADGGDEGSGKFRDDGPPRSFGMGQLVPGTLEGFLHVRDREPSVPDRQGQVSEDRGMRFKRRVKCATGAINRKQSKHRVLAGCSRGGSHGNFNSGVVQAGIRQAHGFASIHHGRYRRSARYERGIDASFPESFVPVDAATEVT